jgi:hypothetical protein
MEALRLSMLFLHFVGLAALLGGFLVQWRAGARVVTSLMVAAAGIQVLTGLLLIASNELQDNAVDRSKVMTKFAIALAVVVFARLGQRRTGTAWLFWATGLLTLANVAVAVFWT